MATAKGLTADLLAARREGLSYAAIAARFGITKQAAWERVTRAEKADASPFERVVELRNAGRTAKEIEKKTGLTHAVVLKHISAGIAAGRIARRVVRRLDREPEILALREAGKTTKQIATDLGISANVVREVIALAIEQGRARKLSREETLSRYRTGYGAYRAGKAKPAPAPAEPAVTYTLPPDFDPATVDTATAGDVIAIIERPITEADDDYLPEPVVEVKPQRAPALNAPFVAEVYNRHGMQVVRERWPEFTDAALNEAIKVGQRMVAPPAEEPDQPLGVRIWNAIRKLFGRS